jgi:hypothetical protein
MTDRKINNTTTAAAELPTTHTCSIRKEPSPAVRGGKMAYEVNSRSFGEEMVASAEAEIENESTSLVHLDAIQQTSGNNKSFDERMNDLMSFKAKYGHCDVSTKYGENAKKCVPTYFLRL